MGYSKIFYLDLFLSFFFFLFYLEEDSRKKYRTPSSVRVKEVNAVKCQTVRVLCVPLDSRTGRLSRVPRDTEKDREAGRGERQMRKTNGDIYVW